MRYLLSALLLSTLLLHSVDSPAVPSLSFDGVDDEITIEPSPTLDIRSEITIEAWVYWKGENGVSNFQMILVKDTIAYEISVGDGIGNGNLLWALGDVNTTAPEVFSGWRNGGNLPRHQWVHVCFTYDGSFARTYFDGDLQTSYITTGLIRSQPSNPVRIGGRDPVGFPSNFNGFIDEVRIWELARTTEQIRENYTIPLQGNETGLVAYYPFDEGEGQTAQDISGNGNNGTLGASPTTEASDPLWAPGVFVQNPLAMAHWTLYR